MISVYYEANFEEFFLTYNRDDGSPCFLENKYGRIFSRPDMIKDFLKTATKVGNL